VKPQTLEIREGVRDADTQRPFLQLKHVSLSYGGVSALEDVSLDFWKGRSVCLVGDNGAGKSSIVKLITGLRRPHSGGMLEDSKSDRDRDRIPGPSTRREAERGAQCVHGKRTARAIGICKGTLAGGGSKPHDAGTWLYA